MLSCSLSSIPITIIVRPRRAKAKREEERNGGGVSPARRRGPGRRGRRGRDRRWRCGARGASARGGWRRCPSPPRGSPGTPTARASRPPPAPARAAPPPPPPRPGRRHLLRRRRHAPPGPRGGARPDRARDRRHGRSERMDRDFFSPDFLFVFRVGVVVFF